MNIGIKKCTVTWYCSTPCIHGVLNIGFNFGDYDLISSKNVIAT